MNTASSAAVHSLGIQMRDAAVELAAIGIALHFDVHEAERTLR